MRARTVRCDSCNARTCCDTNADIPESDRMPVHIVPGASLTKELVILMQGNLEICTYAYDVYNNL